MTFIKYLITMIHLFAQPCHRSKVLFCASADAKMTPSKDKLKIADGKQNGSHLVL